jgi:GxxExxY protein
MHTDKEDDNELTRKVIGCAYAVQNELGSGFLEKVYENAMVHELGKQGIAAVQQAPIEVRYDGVQVGEYFADLFVQNRLIVELKAVKAIASEHSAQVLNYLKATGQRLALIINFGTPKVEVKRLAL